MENTPGLQEMINTWKEKLSEREVKQEDLNWINAVGRDYREKILGAIPASEDIFCELCIDEDVNGNLFFATGI